MCDRMTDRMTRNSQHGTQKPSAWYALGLKMYLAKKQISKKIPIFYDTSLKKSNIKYNKPVRHIKMSHSNCYFDA